MTVDSGPARQRPRSDALSLLAVFLVALVARAVLLVVAVDIPGDGPSHAFAAYSWARSPHWVSHGVWPPAFLYLGGLANILMPRPAVTVRAVNVLVGSLTAVILFGWARRVHGSRVAWVSGLAVALFPLHLSLSASSMSEASFVLWLILAAYLLGRTVDCHDVERTIPQAAVLALGFVVVAQMTRYEAWVLSPLFGAFVFFCSDRSWRSLALVITILIAFPLLWTIGNASYYGDPFVGFTEPRASAVRSFGPRLFGLIDSIARVARAWGDHLSIPVALLTAGGFLLESVSLVRRKSTPARALHIGLMAGFWLFAVGLAVLRGPKLYNRYLVLGFVLSFPFLGVALEAMSQGRNRRWLLSASLLLAVSLISAGGVPIARPLWVTRQHPTPVIELVQWLRHFDHRGQPILLTVMEWQSTYFPLYGPELQWEIFAYRDDVASVRERLETMPNAFLLVTRREDASLVDRIQTWAPRLAQLRRIHESHGFIVLAGAPPGESVFPHQNPAASEAR
jgi:4-amino-4-deoxy-L-arabinose transferase-like glycosyltransferase